MSISTKRRRRIIVRYKIMESIAVRYAEIKDAIVYDNKEDELIAECYKYKIFNDNP